MTYKMDELLLIEHLTYLPDAYPFLSVLNADNQTVREYLMQIDVDKIDDEKVFGQCMNGFDWKNIIKALERKPSILDAFIAHPHLDTAYGGGGGRAAGECHHELLQARTWPPHNDVGYHELHRAFLTKLSKLDSGKKEEKPAVNPDELKDAYKALREVVPEMDYDSTEMIIDQVLSYKLPEKDEEVFGKLKTYLKALNWDEMEKLIQDK